MRKLLTENFRDWGPCKVITEEKNGVKKIFLTGPSIMVDKENGNGRIYPSEVMVPAINDYLKFFMNKRRSVGELGHREDDDIDFERVSHVFVELKKKNSNYYYSKAEVLPDMPKGKIVKTLIDNKIPLGMSTRGVGEEDDDGTITEYKFVTAGDIVWEPSVSEAIQTVLYEKKMNLFSEKQNDKIKKREKKLNAKDFKKEFNLFIENILRS